MKSPSEALYERLDELHQEAAHIEQDRDRVRHLLRKRDVDLESQAAALDADLDQVNALISAHVAAIRVLEGKADA